MTTKHEREIVRELTEDLKSGRMTRGDFVNKALAMGLTLAAAGQLLESHPAFAESPAERELRLSAKKTYQYWTPFAGPDGPHMKLMVDRYNAAHPGTYFNLTRVGGGYETKMTASAIAHTLPDVAVYRADFLPDAIIRNIFEPIDDIVAENHVSPSDYNPTIWNAGSYKGHHYSIPLDTHVAVLYYNKDILHRAGINAPPTNRPEFDQAIAAIKKLGGGIQAFPVPSGCWMHFQNFYYQMGGEMFSSDQKEAIFNNAIGERTARFLLDLIQNGYSAKNISDEGNTAFYNKRAGLWLDGIWWLNGVKQTGINFSGAPVPYLFEKKVAWTGSHQLVLPTKARSSADRRAIGQFMTYLTQNTVEWAKGGQIPASAKVRASAAFQAIHPQVEIAAEEPYVKLLGTFPGAGTAWFGGFFKSMPLVFTGKLSIKEGLNMAVAETNKELAAIRASLGQGSGGSD